MGMGLAARRCSVYRQISGPRRSLTLQTTSSGGIRRQQQNHRHHVLFFSQTAYQDPTLAWAQSNPGLAQECLNPPPLSNGMDLSAGNMMGSLENYLEWRRWELPDEISDKSQDGTFGDQRENARALISHLLSAPLTLASQFKHIFKHCANDNTKDGSIALDWCCVGARAEATIPLVYWKEFLMSSRASLSTEDCRLDIALDFIGPDIPPKLLEQYVTIPDSQDENHSSVASLSLRGYHRGYFHDSPAMQTTNPNTKSWDAYIFFNPGFGHPNLRKSWESTLKLILGREGTQKPPSTLLLTAHSELDMARDASILSSVYDLKDIVYHENPFASRISYEDPFEKNHFVRPNHYVATVVI